MPEVGLAPLRPTALPVLPDNIPASLACLPQWVLWRFDLTRGSWAKVPYQTNGKRASSTTPSTWTTFSTVLAAYSAGGYDGIGIVVDGAVADDGLTLAAVDIDKAIGDPEREARAHDIIKRIGGYTERSPSGLGYRIFLRARPLRSGVLQDGIELYTSGRYLTVTGHVVGVPHE